MFDPTLEVNAYAGCEGGTAFMAATEGAEKALVADLAPRALIGTAYGWFHLVSGALLLPASLLFGWFYEKMNVRWAFGFSAACVFCAVLLLQFFVQVPQAAAKETAG